MPENPIQDPASKNPKEQGPKPDHGQGKIAHPGFTADMHQKPDHGEESYQGLGRLTGKVALITGGDSGIGKAVAIAFAREGADVLLSYLPEEEEEEQDGHDTATWIEKTGRRAVELLYPALESYALHVRNGVSESNVLEFQHKYYKTRPIGAGWMIVAKSPFHQKCRSVNGSRSPSPPHEGLSPN